MRVFVEVELGCKRAQPLQRRIAEAVHLNPGNRIHPTDNLVEDGEMCQASDTTAADHFCPTFVAKFVKPLYVAEQVWENSSSDAII
jgi:hypothetical protein